MRKETALTRERQAAAPANAAVGQAKKDALELATQRMGYMSREAIDLAMKSQRKAGDPPPEVPGASIEANFKPFQILVDGEAGSRPIDALLANLNELYRQLTLAADNPTQATQALDQVEVQVASLRSNVTRLPQPLACMMDKVANDAAGDANATSIAQISDAMAEQVAAPCQQIAANRYPFSRSDRDVPMADFARLFAPNGVIDRFFATNLAPLVNLTGKTWTWRPNPNMARKLSDTTLREFQQAAEIRDAFFPTGGNQPNVSLEVKPLTLSSDAQTATLSINGATVVAQQGANAASTVQWPGAGAGAASIVMAPDMPDCKSNLERTGAWALFRLVDVGSAIQNGNAVKVSFVVGGREVSYQFTSASLNNPADHARATAIQVPQRIVRFDARRSLRQTAGQTRFRRRQRAAAIPRGLGVLASGERGDLAPDARRGVERGLQPRADLALLAGRRLLRRSDDRRLHALGRRRRAFVSARRFRWRRRGLAAAARARLQRPMVRSRRDDSARCARSGRILRGDRGEDRRDGGARLAAARGRNCPASRNCRKAACWCATSIDNCRSPFAPRVVSAIAALSPRSPSGGRSAAKASRRSRCRSSACLRRRDSRTC